MDAALHGGAAGEPIGRPPGRLPPGHLGSLTRAIAPAAERVKGQPQDALDRAVRANIALVVDQLKASKPILAPLVRAGTLKVVGGRYDLESGVADVRH